MLGWGVSADTGISQKEYPAVKCPTCKERMACVDSRNSQDGVRRRYKCPCSASWSSVEMIVGEPRKGAGLMEQMQERFKEEARIELREQILNVLGVEMVHSDGEVLQ